MTHEEETRNFLGDPPNQDPEFFPDDDDYEYMGPGEATQSTPESQIK